MIQPLTIAACTAAATLLCALATLTEIVQPRAEYATVLVAVQPFAGDEALWVDASVRGKKQPHELFDSQSGGEQ